MLQLQVTNKFMETRLVISSAFPVGLARSFAKQVPYVYTERKLEWQIARPGIRNLNLAIANLRLFVKAALFAGSFVHTIVLWVGRLALTRANQLFLVIESAGQVNRYQANRTSRADE